MARAIVALAGQGQTRERADSARRCRAAHRDRLGQAHRLEHLLHADAEQGVEQGEGAGDEQVVVFRRSTRPMASNSISRALSRTVCIRAGAIGSLLAVASSSDNQRLSFS
jgi:hypothetical protein